MCEIFIDSDYNEFLVSNCNKCKGFNCKISEDIMKSYFDRSKFPTDKIKRIDGEWKCKEFYLVRKTV